MKPPPPLPPRRREFRPTDDPTYKNVGECPKCIGSVTPPQTRFDGDKLVTVEGKGEVVGILWAICQLCGFQWTVKTRDELDE